MEEISTESIQHAAQDINQILGLKPQMEIDGPVDRLTSSLKTVSELIDANDDLKESTWQVLITLNFLKPNVISSLQSKYPVSKIPSTKSIVIPEVPTLVVEQPVSIVSEVALVAQMQVETDVTQKKVKSTKTPKSTTPKLGGTRGKRNYAALVEKLINEGLHTGKDIVNAVLAEYPTVKADSVRTFISDSKNLKYTTFSKKVVVGPDEKVRFED